MRTAKRRRGRPRGSYSTWSPQKIATFLWNAQIASEELDRDGLAADYASVAERLKQKYPRKYYQTAEQLQKMLSAKTMFMRQNVLSRLLGAKKRT
jgi:hypothetical protein